MSSPSILEYTESLVDAMFKPHPESVAQGFLAQAADFNKWVKVGAKAQSEGEPLNDWLLEGVKYSSTFHAMSLDQVYAELYKSVKEKTHKKDDDFPNKVHGFLKLTQEGLNNASQIDRLQNVDLSKSEEQRALTREPKKAEEQEES